MDNLNKSLCGNTAKGRVARQIAAMSLDGDIETKALNIFNSRCLSFRHVEDAMDIARRDERQKVLSSAASPAF